MKPTQRTEALALIRERCVAANPERFVGKKATISVTTKFGRNETDIGTWNDLTLCLADVMLAIREGRLSLSGTDHFIFTMWKLKEDDLDAQDEEVLLFLANLLK